MITERRFIKIFMRYLPFAPLIIAIPLWLFGIFNFLLIKVSVGMSLLLWLSTSLFAPLFELHSLGQRAVDVLERVIPDIQKSSNFITSLSAGAILLTFSIIRVLSGKFSDKDALIRSWYFFGASIVTGIIIGIIAYILRAHYLVLIKPAERRKEELQSLLDKVHSLEISLFFCAFLQLLTFLTSMVYAILFAIKNI